ncbi:MAG: peptidoglycan DD-metalloendopeptidase family protein [Muribaculaceae bacterium]|nr:peptidoglycan DD-metalloendopeptidase family protein [Muribaculaceae bacterium]
MKYLHHHILRILPLALACVVALSSGPVAVSAASPKGKKTATSGSGKKTTTAASGKKKKGTGRRSGSGTAKGKVPGSSAEAKRMRDAAEKDIRQTKEQLRLNEQEMKQGLSDLNRLSSEIKDGRRQVSDLQGKVSSLQTEITALGDEIAKNEADLARMREEYLKAVKKMRLTRKNRSALAFVFASENFNQAMRRIRYIRQFSKWKDKKTSDIDAKITLLSGEREKLAGVKEMHASALTRLNSAQKTLETKHQRQEQLVAGLRRNGDMLQSHLASKQNEANRLNASISQLIAQEQAKAEAERKAREKAESERIAREKARAEAERRAAEEAEARAAAEKEAAARSDVDREAAEKEAKKRAEEEKKAAKEKEKAEKKAAKKKAEEEKKRKKNSEKGSRRRTDRKPTKAVESPSKSAVQSTAPNVNFAALRGSLPRPVDGGWRITNPFGRHSMPELPEVVYDNPGIDAEVAKGSTVKAVCAGKVSGVYKVSGYGSVVIVNHGEYYTVYGNLSSVSVSVGSRVNTGQTVGSAAADPDDPRRGSVHFEVWKGREKQNPESWIR